MALRVPVTFEPQGITVWVESGVPLTLAAEAAGVSVALPCGGRGICGGCAVKVAKGALASPAESEYSILRRAPEGVRLACQARVSGAVTVSVLQNDPREKVCAFKSPGFEGPPVIAIDCGSTTITVLVADSATGLQHSRASVINGQAGLGTDIVSRVDLGLRGHGSEMQAAITKSLSCALESACAAAGIDLADVQRTTVVGNPVMIATLLGVDLSGFAAAPYLIPEQVKHPVHAEPLARILGLSSEIFILPPIASFVGGDMGAGLFASGVDRQTQSTLYLDIGTNAEIALVHDGRITVTSVPAGPAFEGHGIAYGGVFGEGAVTGARLGGHDILLEVEGASTPKRLCGSGLVSVITLLRQAGHIDAAGRVWPQGPLGYRFKNIQEELAFALGEDGSGPYVFQSDVRAFQLAKAAVSAGVRSLIEKSGVSVRHTIVSGAFGGAVTAKQMMRLGIIPSDTGEVRVFNDAALLGAMALALSPDSISGFEDLYEIMAHEELATSDLFKRVFVDATSLEPWESAHP